MAKVVHDHEENVEEVSSQDVLRPVMMDDIVPAFLGILENTFHDDPPISLRPAQRQQRRQRQLGKRFLGYHALIHTQLF